jgi:hypothetical protein
LLKGQNTFPSSGNVGIGTTSPIDALNIVTGATNGGATIKQTTYGSAVVTLDNVTTGGRKYVIGSTGVGNAQGAGHFSIYDYTGATDRFLITSSGDVGIGTNSPSSKLHVVGGNVGVRGDGGATGVAGNGISSGNVGTVIGVMGWGIDGATNYGGYFGGKGAGAGVTSYGVYATISLPTLGSTNYAVYATVAGNHNNGNGPNYAGWFDGDVVTPGGSYYYSDRKIKKDVAGINNSLDIISKLNPVSYNFDAEKNSDLALPLEKQYGFISQEIKEILPEFTKVVVHPAKVDDKGNEMYPKRELLALNYNGFIALLTKGIQEQQAQIEAQGQLISELQKKVGISTGLNEAGGTSSFAMNQNEPNPFGSETVIKYSLPQTVAKANLVIYDLTGKQITSFPIEQKGSSSITVTSEKLAAGIYIYSIVADGKVVDTKRMIVAEK